MYGPLYLYFATVIFKTSKVKLHLRSLSSVSRYFVCVGGGEGKGGHVAHVWPPCYLEYVG